MGILLAASIAFVAYDANAYRADFAERLGKVVGYSENRTISELGKPTIRRTHEEATAFGNSVLYEMWQYHSPNSRYPDLGTLAFSAGTVRTVFGAGPREDLPEGATNLMATLFDSKGCYGQKTKLLPVMELAEAFSRMPRAQSAAILREFIRTEPVMTRSFTRMGAHTVNPENPYSNVERFALISALLEKPKPDWSFRFTGNMMRPMVEYIEEWPIVLSIGLWPESPLRQSELDWIKRWEEGLPGRINFSKPKSVESTLREGLSRAYPHKEESNAMHFEILAKQSQP